MIPKPIYNEPLDRIIEMKHCLVVDNDDDIVRDYEVLIGRLHPYTTVEHRTQADAPGTVRERNYACVIVDNDGFRIKEYPGLDTVRKMLQHIEPDSIIYTSALPDDDLRERSSSLGIHFVEKGDWRFLEELLQEILQQETPVYNWTL